MYTMLKFTCVCAVCSHFVYIIKIIKMLSYVLCLIAFQTESGTTEPELYETLIAGAKSIDFDMTLVHTDHYRTPRHCAGPHAVRDLKKMIDFS